MKRQVVPQHPWYATSEPVTVYNEEYISCLDVARMLAYFNTKSLARCWKSGPFVERPDGIDSPHHGFIQLSYLPTLLTELRPWWSRYERDMAFAQLQAPQPLSAEEEVHTTAMLAYMETEEFRTRCDEAVERALAEERAKLITQMRGAVWDQLSAELRPAVTQSLRDELADEVRESLRRELRNKVRNELQNELSAEIHRKIRRVMERQ